MLTTTEPGRRMEPTGSGYGMLLTPATPGAQLSELHTAGLDQLLIETGHILIRGYSPTVEDFNALVAAYSTRLTMDPARAFNGSAAQQVDSGYDPIGLHLENGATPFGSDLLWFTCVTAARSGSQTTVCDGYRVLDRLSAEAREAFAAQPLRYTRSGIPRQLWQRLAAFLRGDGAQPREMTVEDLYAVANPGAQVRFSLDRDGNLSYDYVVSAAGPTRWSDRLAWANSLFGPSYNYRSPDIRFADGRPIDDDLLAEARQACEEVTEEIDWQDGDVVLIDNSRVMHGRRAITDPRRSILNAQSYARAAASAQRAVPHVTPAGDQAAPSEEREDNQ